jgi:hypothetical protein
VHPGIQRADRNHGKSRYPEVELLQQVHGAGTLESITRDRAESIATIALSGMPAVYVPSIHAATQYGSANGWAIFGSGSV